MLKMKLTGLIGAVALLVGVLSTPLMAGSFGIGISGEGMFLETSGSETMKPDNATGTSLVSSATEDGSGGVASAYIQYTFGEDGFVIGVERMPGSVTLGHNTRTTQDAIEGNDDNAVNLVTQNVKARVDSVTSYYVETPSFGGIFAKVGYTTGDLQTQEALATGSSYADDTLDGYTVGLGIRGTADNGLHMKILGEYTDFDQVTLTSTGSDVASTIKGDVETYGLKLSIGMNF